MTSGRSPHETSCATATIKLVRFLLILMKMMILVVNAKPILPASSSLEDHGTVAMKQQRRDYWQWSICEYWITPGDRCNVQFQAFDAPLYCLGDTANRSDCCKAYNRYVSCLVQQQIECLVEYPWHSAVIGALIQQINADRAKVCTEECSEEDANYDGCDNELICSCIDQVRQTVFTDCKGPQDNPCFCTIMTDYIECIRPEVDSCNNPQLDEEFVENIAERDGYCDGTYCSRPEFEFEGCDNNYLCLCVNQLCDDYQQKCSNPVDDYECFCHNNIAYIECIRPEVEACCNKELVESFRSDVETRDADCQSAGITPPLVQPVCVETATLSSSWTATPPTTITPSSTITQLPMTK